MLAGGLLVYDYVRVREVFPPLTFISTVDVSELEPSEAADKLRSVSLSELYGSVITFETSTANYSFSPEAIGISLDYEQTVKNAFALTHNKGYLKELKGRLKNQAALCPLVLKADDQLAKGLLSCLADELRFTARDATIVLFEETGGYHIEAEDLGKELDLPKTIASLQALLAKGEKVFPLILDLTEPRVTEKILRANPPAHRLAAYTTYYGSHDSPNRISNIKLVASWLDNRLLMPGDIVSVADALGEITPERGFKEAFVIVQGQLVPLLGGGSCQIATTLYNAVQLADLKIIQRRNHSMYFNIYPLGRDAGVYPGQLDFKFENSSGYPVLIKSLATNRRLSFRIYGTPSGKTVKFSPPLVFILTSSGYKPSTVRTVLAADSPFKTIVKRTVYDSSGQLLTEEAISSSYKLYGEKSNVPIARPEPR